MHELDANFLEKFIVAGFPGIKLTTLSTYVNSLRSFVGAAQNQGMDLQAYDIEATGKSARCLRRGGALHGRGIEIDLGGSQSK